jgi:hypothetical protein
MHWICNGKVTSTRVTAPIVCREANMTLWVLAKRGLSKLAVAAIGATWLIYACHADSNIITADKTGSIQITCACVVATSACASRILNAISGQSGIHSWTQPESLVQGHSFDLSLLCWRKRDVDDKGANLCCRHSGQEDDVRFFWGQQ